MPTVAEIQEWWRSPVAKMFKEHIDIHIADADHQVHLHIENNDFDNVKFYNAKMVCFEDVKDIPSQMIDFLEGEK